MTRRIVVDAGEALLVKAIVEAHEGVASVFGEEGGVLTIAAPRDREGDLELVLDDVRSCLARARGAR